MTTTDRGNTTVEKETLSIQYRQSEEKEMGESQTSVEQGVGKLQDPAILTEDIMAALLVDDQPPLEHMALQEKPLFVIEPPSEPTDLKGAYPPIAQSSVGMETDTDAEDSQAVQQAAIAEAAVGMLKKLIVSEPVLMEWYARKQSGNEQFQLAQIESGPSPQQMQAVETQKMVPSDAYATLFPEGFDPSNPAHCETLIQQSLRKTLDGMEHLSEVLKSSAELMQQQKEEAMTAAAQATLTGLFEQAMPGIASLLQPGVTRSAEQNILVNHLCALFEDQLTRKFPHVEHRDERVLTHIVNTVLPEVKHLAKRLGLNERFQPLSVVPPSAYAKVEPAMKGVPSNAAPEFEQALRKGDHLGMVQALFRKK